MAHRKEVLTLYKSFLRIGKSLAEKSPNHSLHILLRAQKEFRAQRHLTDPQEIKDEIDLARCLLETLELQAGTVDEGFGKHRKKNATTATDRSIKDDFW